MNYNNKEAFVYCWTNHTNGRIYVGYHKGSPDDGYVCSSMSDEFWNDFNNKKMKWSRQVIGTGSAKDCSKLEVSILKNLNLNEVYNNGIASIVMTEEVKKKISNSQKGKIFSKETRKIISEDRKNRRHFTNGFKNVFVVPGQEPEGFYLGRKNVSAKKRGPRTTEDKYKISASSIGKTHSEETKRKMSDERKLRKHFTNGVKNVFVVPGQEPEGFKPGRTTK